MLVLRPRRFLPLLLLLSGCQAGREEEARVLAARVKPPEGWSPSASAPSVPGTLLAAWSGPDGATLSLYRTLGVPDPDPTALGRELANRLTNFPGTRVLRVETIAGPGSPAALVEAVAPGDGGRLAPNGLGTPKLESGDPIPTRQVSVGRPGPARTLWLVAHYPESAHDRLGPAVEATLLGWDPGTASTPTAAGY